MTTTVIEQAWLVRQANFPPEVEFVYPRRTEVVSVTGNDCALKCAHCGGHYLKHMRNLKAGSRGDKPGTTSYLISGGCDREGRVPLAPYWEELASLKQGKRYNFHVGLADTADISALARLADVVSFDLVGDDDTVREVYGLHRSAEEYWQTYRALKAHCRVLPHLCLGLRGGKLSGEEKALHRLKEEGAEGLVLLVFTPTKNTAYADCAPLPAEEVAGLMARARILFPSISIHLGCMRPGGRYRRKLDELALRCGVNKIVQPVPALTDLAVALGLKIVETEECCVL